jgi:hypothetical protein
MSGKNFRATDDEVADIVDTTDSDTCSDDDCGTAPPRTADPPPTAASVAQPLAVPMDTTMSTPEAQPDTRGPNAQLDLAFCCDCTGSMGAYIRSAQDNILAIAQQIHAAKSQQCSLRFALVKYRDHPPQDSTFVTEVYPFTQSLDVMKSNVDTMAAAGGGDGPEAVTAGLHEVLNLNWREGASKVCVFIADAPPHGLGESGDGFPNGSPDGHDPIVITKAMAEKGIAVYAVGVEPTLSTSYKFARDFMMMVAKVTGGKFVPLGKADILSKVIVGTALEGIGMEEQWATLQAEVEAEALAKNEALTKDELCDRVEQAMADKRTRKEVKMQKVRVANPYMDARYDRANQSAFAEAMDLAAARKNLNPHANSHVAKESAGYRWTEQDAMCDMEDDMSDDQMDRFVVQKACKRK